MKLISVENITVRYDATVALENASLDIYSDDFLGIIGPNGGGKTTLVKALLGLISYSGNIVYDQSLYRAHHLNIGYLPQVSQIDPNFPISVREIVLSGLQSAKRIKNPYRREDKIKVDSLLDEFGLAELADRQIGETSGGQLQRTLLCRALISEPNLLILDEPANSVDNKFEHELYGVLKKQNAKMAIVMVSHDVGTISSIVKNIVCVNKHVHRHDSNTITAEQLENYDCPMQLLYHGDVPHTVLGRH